MPWLLGLTAKTPIPHVEAADQVALAELRFFSPQQMATLTRLSDVLMPPIDEKPGAVQAQTPMFLDFLIGDSPDTRKQVYSEGLDWLDAEAKKKFNVEFAKLTDEQADALLKPWLRTWMNDHPPDEKHADFVNIAHDDIRTATVNSKAWFAAPQVGAEPRTEEELYWSPIEPDISLEKADCAQCAAACAGRAEGGSSDAVVSEVKQGTRDKGTEGQRNKGTRDRGNHYGDAE